MNATSRWLPSDELEDQPTRDALEARSTRRRVRCGGAPSLKICKAPFELGGLRYLISFSHCGRLYTNERIVSTPPEDKKLLSKILVVSRDPGLADVRKRVLESAGFKVIAATSESAISDLCEKQKPRLVLIGYSLAPSAKRRVWDEARKKCKVPILELHKEGGPELMPPAYFHQSEMPDDFLKTVQKILSN